MRYSGCNARIGLVLLIVAAVGVGGCWRVRSRVRSWMESSGSPVTPQNLTPEQSAYLEKAREYPLSFTIEASEAPRAWDRARDFLQRFSTLRVVSADDRVISTESPQTNLDVGYTVSKRTYGDHIKIWVETETASRFSGDPIVARARNNAHLLAYYIGTGVLDPSLVVR